MTPEECAKLKWQAAIDGGGEMTMPNSLLTEVDPNMSEIFDDMDISAPIPSLHTIGMLNDMIAIYFGSSERMFR
ncbi:hypothetical protein AB9F29_16115 [Falsihalocynthiibacter sp. S25ZX9]|uniref:hypothetical protein n=1 Tax=unclassified Falsihalocynthiibacter TaxID=2854191 RepID=UPI0035100CDB